jgi:hypothetical protein
LSQWLTTYCHSRGLLVRVESHRDIILLEKDGLVLEVDATTLDWALTVYDAATKHALCSEWYDIYYKLEGREFDTAFEQSIREFFDDAITSPLRVVERPGPMLLGPGRVLRRVVDGELRGFEVFD